MSRPGHEVREIWEVGEMPTQKQIDQSHGSFWLRLDLQTLAQLLASLDESQREAEARHEPSVLIYFDKHRDGEFGIWVAHPEGGHNEADALAFIERQKRKAAV